MNTLPTQTLLRKARSFINKSAVIAIAPLALAPVAHAAADPTFQVPTNSAGFSASGFTSGGSETFDETNFSASALPKYNFITGVIISVSGNFSTAGGFGDGQFVSYPAAGTISGAALPPNMTIPVSYSFTLSTNGGSSVDSWVLNFGLGNATPYTVSGSGYGVHSGSMDLDLDSSFSSYTPFLEINVTNFGENEILTLDMTGQGRGISYNTVPEPSTFGLLFGGAILGFLTIRKRSLRHVV